jgi:hypothetical protein
VSDATDLAKNLDRITAGQAAQLSTIKRRVLPPPAPVVAIPARTGTAAPVPIGYNP